MRRGVVVAGWMLAWGAPVMMAQGLLGAESSAIHSTDDLSSNGAIAAMMNPITGQPYTATKSTHSVWKLADGTTIRHEAETKIARDGEGRVREDVEVTRAMSMGGKQTNMTVESVMVADPVDHSLLTWTGKAKFAMRMQMPDFSALTKKRPMGGLSGILSGAPPPPVPPRPPSQGLPNIEMVKPEPAALRLGRRDGGDGSAYDVAMAQTPGTGVHKDAVHTEDLGKQSIAGVLVTGKRTTTVIPMDEIGNDQPITVVHEEWYSPELKVVVKTYDSDPRSGERTMELEGLTRGEPDAALFHAPEGYEVKDMAGMMKSLGGVGKPAETK
jgi:hypothetical protein